MKTLLSAVAAIALSLGAAATSANAAPVGVASAKSETAVGQAYCYYRTYYYYDVYGNLYYRTYYYCY